MIGQNTNTHFFKTVFSVLVIGLGLSSCTSTGEIPDLKTAKQALKDGDYARAKAHYSYLAEKGYPQAKVGLAKIDLQTKDRLSQAERVELERILMEDADTDSPKIFTTLADLELSASSPDYDKVFSYYNKAFQAGDTKVAVKAGDLARDIGQTRMAKDWYVMAYHSGDERGIYRLGRLYEKGGRGLAQNYVTSLGYFLWSKELGVSGSDKGIARISKKISVDSQKKAAENLDNLKSSLVVR